MAGESVDRGPYEVGAYRVWSASVPVLGAVCVSLHVRDGHTRATRLWRVQMPMRFPAAVSQALDVLTAMVEPVEGHAAVAAVAALGRALGA